MSYHEYVTSSGGVRRQHHQGKRFQAEHLDADQLLASLEEANPESMTWQMRALRARDAMRDDESIPDEIYIGFWAFFDPVHNSLTWKEIFYVWRIAHLTWRITGGCGVVELATNCGLA